MAQAEGAVGPTPVAVAGRAARPVMPLWDRLVAMHDESGRTVERDAIAALPPAARRWLTRAIAPGARRAGRVVLSMHGEIKVGRWLPFHAVQVLAPACGFVWAARAGRVVRVEGFDRFVDGEGAMRWTIGGRVPIVRARGRDVSRSAAGRLAGESVLVPVACVDRPWQADGEDAAVMSWDVDGETVDVRVRVDDEGRLVSADFARWGNPGREPAAYHPFGVTVDDESTFEGMTIPSSFRAGWWWGSRRFDDDGEFFRANITAAHYA